MELTNIYEIIAEKLIETTKNLGLSRGSFYFDIIHKAAVEEFGSEKISEVVKALIENPRKSYDWLVKVLGGFKSTAKALMICVIGELIKKYSPGFEILNIIRAVERGDRDALLDYAIYSPKI